MVLAVSTSAAGQDPKSSAGDDSTTNGVVKRAVDETASELAVNIEEDAENTEKEVEGKNDWWIKYQFQFPG